MTLPTATNTDPALRARIAAILAPFPGPVAEALAGVAEMAAGWREGCTADVKRYAVTRAGSALSRPLSPAESAALEACIRAHIEASTEPPAARWEDLTPARRATYMTYIEAVAPIPKPTAHPSLAEMVRAESLEGRPGASRFAAGIEVERARLRTLLLDLADVRIEAARALNDPAPRDMSAAIEAAEFVGEARALRELAAGLK